MSMEYFKYMSKTEAAVFAAIKADNSMTAKKIAEKIGKSEKLFIEP